MPATRGSPFFSISASTPSDSEHWPVVAEFTYEAVLGMDGETLKSRTAVMGHRSPVLVSDTAICEKFSTATDKCFDMLSIVEDTIALEARDDVRSDLYFTEVNALFDSMLKAMNDSSDALANRPRRAAVWRRHNDDGANLLRTDHSAARSVLAATSARSGPGRRSKILQRVMDKHPAVATLLNVSNCRIASWATWEDTDTATIKNDIADLNANAALLALDLSREISTVASANVRHQFATHAQKSNRRGQRCLRNLTDFVMARARRAGHYASLVQQDPSAPTNGRAPTKMRVTSDPKEVATGLVKHFFEWMGGNKTFWFTGTAIDSNGPAGKELRRSILDGTLTDLEAAGIPIRFKPVIAALRRVKGAGADLYKNVLCEITDEEWSRKLATTKKGTAPGLSRETIDMLAALSPASSSLLRRVMNLMLRSRRVFSQWLRRAICPVPKVVGNPDVKLSRPLTLLSVSGKVFWSILSGRVTTIWRENDLLQRQQYGF